MRTYNENVVSDFVNADAENSTSVSTVKSKQDETLSWHTKAKNVLITYNKTRTVTTDLLLELISLIDSKQTVYYDDDGEVIDPNNPQNFDNLTGIQIRDKLQSLLGEHRLDASAVKNIASNVFINVGGEQINLQTYLDTYCNLDHIVQDLSNPTTDTVLSTAGLQAVLASSSSSSKTFIFGDDVETDFTFAHGLATTNIIFVIHNNDNQIYAWPDTTTAAELFFSFAMPPQPNTVITIFNSMQAASKTFIFGDDVETLFEFVHTLSTDKLIFVIRQNAKQIFAWPTILNDTKLVFDFVIPPEPGTTITIFK